MTISFACAASHAPGMTAWADAAEPRQKDALYAAYRRLRAELDASGAEVIVLLTSEHWVNFFLDHISAFCIGRGTGFEGPVEPWLKVAQARLRGDEALADQFIAALYDADFEPSFSHELLLDHGSMVPLHFLDPESKRAVVPIMFNTLAPPQPSAARALALGKVLGRAARMIPPRRGTGVSSRTSTDSS
jgi:aromatic ring-opening dioxygenase catalytic subunit (LigB family)